MIVDDLGIEALGMAQHAVHEFGALQPLDVAGPVIHAGRGHQLAALLDTGDQDRVQVRSCSVDGGGVAGGSGSQDQNPAMFQVTHV